MVTLECRKCKCKFRAWVKIGNKPRNLYNRKFCLKCSPFGKHNTKPDDPARPNVIKKPYRMWSKKRKDVAKNYIHNREAARKKCVVNLLGGKCKKCGYNKCYRALTFHHRNRANKLFSLNRRTLADKNWDLVLTEVKKCDLLCANCHMETECRKANSLLHCLGHG